MKYLSFIFALLISTQSMALDLDKENYILAEDWAKLPNGYVLGQFTASLIHWVPDTHSNNIKETVVVFLKDQKSGKTCKQIKQMQLMISTNQVEIFEDDILIGKGVLVGESWHWTELSFEVKTAGATIKGVDKFNKTQWETEKTVYNQDGSEIIITAKLRAIDKGTYEILSGAGVPPCK